ncbi:hypothetical protein HMPREF1869_00726 [Bacteroidales bacterium KA00251]|nr:hypothetical protein HMPREF1869_00726 [Bacteroidales bacterium KA00251]
MKCYRYLPLILLLALLSTSSLFSQNSYTLKDRDGHYEFEVNTTPSYCQNEGTIEIRLLRVLSGAPLPLSQIQEVGYDIRDNTGRSYTNGYRVESQNDPTVPLLVEQLEGRGDYKIYIRLKAKQGIYKPDIETNIVGDIEVQDKYVALKLIKDEIESYKLTCRPYGKFHITAEAGTTRPPVLNFLSTPPGYKGPKTVSPTKKDVKGNVTLYHFEYSGDLPQGVYKYNLENACRRTDTLQLTVYGPKPDLPQVPANFEIPFYVLTTNGNECTSPVNSFRAILGEEASKLSELFREINKGYKGNPDLLYPEYSDSFSTIFMENYEVLVISQKEYKQLKGQSLDLTLFPWSSQTGSTTSIWENLFHKQKLLLSYTPPYSKSIQDLIKQELLPGALLIRVKRPNKGCNDYITIPINVDLDFREIHSFHVLDEERADCSIGQIVEFNAENFCSLYIKYYELPDGATKPADGAQPVHTSVDFGPSISDPVMKSYTFPGFNPKKRYYVELDIIDLHGNQVTPKPHLIIEPSNQEVTPNRLYDFKEAFLFNYNPLWDLRTVDEGIPRPLYLGDIYWLYIHLRQGSHRTRNALSGMRITLVKAPSGYDKYQKSREEAYYRKPEPGRQGRFRFGGGMIREGETIELSSEFVSSNPNDKAARLYPFRFLYTVGAKGQRIVYPYNNANGTSNLAAIIGDDNDLGNIKFPQGIYRLKFEHPCQPGEEFYINLNISDIDFEPKHTRLIDPLVDYISCDSTRVYPFADGRQDYATDEDGYLRNLVFQVNWPTKSSKEFYFFPKDRDGKTVDHTKFYIPIRNNELRDHKIEIKYRYLRPYVQRTIYSNTNSKVDSVGVEQYTENELRGGKDKNYKLPMSGYNPTNDQEDWGSDGFKEGYSWKVADFKKGISVEVPINVLQATPSYFRPSYIGYRCGKDRGYMEFKLINVPTQTGTVVLKDGNRVIKRENIADLTDRMVHWSFSQDQPGHELKNEYQLEISTSPCPGGKNLPTEKFVVKLRDISEGGEGIAVTFSPRKGICPGEKVTLIADNLGIPDGNYHWTITKASDGKETKLKGRSVTCEVSAPVVSEGKVVYNRYVLKVTGTMCGDTITTQGIIPVSPDELWWMPQSEKIGEVMTSVAPWENVNIDVELSPSLPVATKQSQATPQQKPSGKGVSSPFSPLPKGPAGIKVTPGVLAARETYDWNNPDNWLFLHEGQFYRAQAVPSSCTHVHIVSTLYQDEKNKRVWAPAPDLSPEVTLRDDFGEPTCADITFHSGAEVYDIPQLTYQRAMVRYNFGVNKNTSGRDIGTFGEGDYASDLRLYTSQENFASDVRLYMRDSLYLLAAPLYDIYAGDYSFSASPYTYQLGFKAVPAGNNTVATFDASAFNDPSPLQSISMVSNNNSIGLVVADDEQGFKSREGKSTIMERRGILELPYFDRPDVAKPFYHHTYNAGRGESRFQYFDGTAKRFRRYYSYAKRSKMAYRFIFEDPATRRIPKLTNGKEGYKLKVDFGTPAQEVMVGNPFMSTIDLKAFLEANKETLQPYARQMRAKVTSYQMGQSRLALTGKVTTFYSGTSSVDGRYVAPLSAFVVKPLDNVGPKVELIFPKSIVPIGTQTQQKNPLRSATGAPTATTLRYLSLTLQSRLGKDRALVAYGYESGSVDKMLLSTESRYPSIAIVDPADGLHKDLYADDAATGHYKLATQVSEPIEVTLSLTGSVMGHVVTARLIDHKSGLEHDLTGGKSCQIKLFPDDSEGRLELLVDGDFTAVAPAEKPSATLQAQYKQGRLTVRTSEPMSSVRLIQVDGVTLYNQSLPELTEYSEQLFLSTGSYIVETVSTEGTTRRVKLLVQ